MLTVMKVQLTLISLMLLVPLLAISQYDEILPQTSNSPRNAIELPVGKSINFQEFRLNSSENEAINPEEELRAYYDINHYFYFTMPENNSVDLFLKFDDTYIAGIGIYTINESKDFVLKELAYLKQSPNLVNIDQLEVNKGERALIRLWFNEEINTTNPGIEICFKGKRRYSTAPIKKHHS